MRYRWTSFRSRRRVSVQDYSFPIFPESGSPGDRDRLSQESIIAAKQTIAALAALAQRRKCPRHLPWLTRVVDSGQGTFSRSVESFTAAKQAIKVASLVRSIRQTWKLKP
ncbi:uncharacterized protein CIMG_11535 [Coccidioides immitis RS]|uniref:Uncharacterized protein n=2 Tax=Coccidioides TaxID=5500 RepID=A0A0D8JVM6_COCIM|nr:uncharacterized protein CIMG_11535 [Coccidioides immitis RS]EFW17513.1 predicted protein [Coccidioides posadasii str. Silveira]KJF61159.1 hypothetical protein CIMG_11535 [Coccidioides immitis RS]